MYKKVFRALKHDIQKQEKMDEMSNQLGKQPYAFHQPHIILSAENPMYPTDTYMTHEQIKEMLENKGYDVEDLKGKYNGKLGRSLLIKNPPKHSAKHFYDLAQRLGQESIIISTDGHEHELHYTNGPKQGKHQKGQGTAIHNQEPDDFYSTMEDGTHFTHNFSDDLHTNSRFIKGIRRMAKSENHSVYMCKNEQDEAHPLDNPTPDLKLIHYSPQSGLKTIEPKYHGVRRIGEEAKQGAPEHKLSFFYLEGAKPESLVTSGSKSKYVTSLGGMKLYDIAKDKDRLWSKAKELADQRQINRGVVNKDDFHQAIKDAGYHGIYNTGLDKDTMSKVVGLFHPVSPEQEHELHPKDFDEASSSNFHAIHRSMNDAKQHADTHGHHNHEFLHNLKESFKAK